MSNTIELEKVLVDVVAGFELSFPLKDMTNMDLSSDFGDKNGDTIYVKADNYGTVYQTTDLTNKMSDIVSVGVPLKLLPYKMGGSYTTLQKTLSLGGQSGVTKIAKKWGKGFAHDLHKIAYNTALRGASTAVVSTGTFAQLASGINNVQKTNAMGNINGMLSYDLDTLIGKDGTSAFGNSSLAKQLYEGNIKNYRGCDVVAGPTTILATNGVFPAGTITITNASGGFGTTTATFTPTANIASAITVVAGTAITAVVEAVDELGFTTGTKRVFIVQTDVELSGSTGIAIDVGDVFFSGPMKNVSAAISARAVTNLMEASSNYATGVVFNENELMLGMKGIAPLMSNSTTAMDVDTIPIRVSYEGSAKTSTEDMIFDTLFGAGVYTRRGLSGLYVKV